jgi:dTDP-4-amino-4,6-dideoxygalactose transaminase
MIPFVDLKAQYRALQQEIDAAIAGVLQRTEFILGSEVEAFEREFASYCGAGYAVACGSGTGALHLALLAAGIGPGDEVITVPFTFVATVEAICYTGARPVFVDVDETTCLMDAARLEAAITPRTKAVLPVHLYGQCADMDPIVEIARRHDVLVIEDAAQAHGASYKGRRAGSLGDVACFSFYPGKNLGAYGEAGAVVTNNINLVRTMVMLRDHGQRRKYEHALLGYNERMDGIQGAVLRVKLPHLDKWNALRRSHAARYRGALSAAGFRLVEDRDYGEPSYHVFAVFLDDRDAVQDRLKAAAVATGIHYPVPAHLQPAFQFLGYSEGDFPISERLSRTELSLPMFAELTAPQIETVVAALTQDREASARAS